MSYSEVIETRGDYRVCIVADESPFEPESDGNPPLLRIERGKVSHAVSGGDTDALVEAAFERWTNRPGDDGWRYFEKYLRACLGVTTIQPWLSENGNWYVGYDTPAWREYTWNTEEKAGPKWREHLAECDLIGDWRPYTNGDCWDVVVEKRVTWTTSDPDYDDRDTWEEVPDVPGGSIYGREWAEQEARELLSEFAPAEQVSA